MPLGTYLFSAFQLFFNLLQKTHFSCSPLHEREHFCSAQPLLPVEGDNRPKIRNAGQEIQQ